MFLKFYRFNNWDSLFLARREYIFWTWAWRKGRERKIKDGCLSYPPAYASSCRSKLITHLPILFVLGAVEQLLLYLHCRPFFLVKWEKGYIDSKHVKWLTHPFLPSFLINFINHVAYYFILLFMIMLNECFYILILKY